MRAGIDCCVLLNQWDRAVSLAEQHDYPQIEGLLSKYAKHLLDKGEKLQAVELYRKANKATDAAKLLAMIAEDVTKDQADPLRAKKLNVLAALEVCVRQVRGGTPPSPPPPPRCRRSPPRPPLGTSPRHTSDPTPIPLSPPPSRPPSNRPLTFAL